MDPAAIVEPSKTGQPVDPKANAESKDSASTKENDAPGPVVEARTDKDADESAGKDSAGPEADIDSDEEAALREAGL